MLVPGEGPGAATRTPGARGPIADEPSPGARRPSSAAARDRASRYRERIVDAALGCIAERGVAATTADDVARRAGCSRATLYRVFPGGKDAVLAAAVETEAARCMAHLAVRMGSAPSAEDVVVEGVLGACRWLAGNRALARVLELEPEVLAPRLAFEAESRLLEQAATWAAPFLRRWLAAPDAYRMAEWAARMVLVYGLGGSGTHDATDEDWVRHLVRTFVTPGIEALRGGPGSGRADGGDADWPGDRRAEGGKGAAAGRAAARRGAARGAATAAGRASRRRPAPTAEQGHRAEGAEG